ncbi:MULTISPECIES: Lrp/AsnC family transcriptional regulator [Brevibacterium]|uniref:AsnC family transcriptional regulator n=2 Tax=Brevibacterium casei TaxID=33889 RepID=K9B484_9MICO|nr:Lrp/AsnC family transcriptional regulator [Brevibacterium casei]NJE68503.1 Lrp/AsnC family transcriptional regulator [Brevibacterium sp. LS14]EKU49647.1 AsnC family transcriptional regulator [Brevibacterium casei S18]KZE16144.1 transcriptional regulator [Brevibacterium casei]MBE4693736.1 Lrp/AsnC family transcriptional regulator [Brevibacterium casei]MBY3576859.1 Lrp/AsnC family transcriptional regulator [Brevibacterium casei]
MSQKVELDDVDLRLLRALRRNARASGSALAAEVGISESTVSLRLKRLRSSGVIRGFSVDIDTSALGIPLQALISIRLAQHDRAEIDAFTAAAPKFPGVVRMYHMAGADDYLLHIVAPDTEAVQSFVLDYLTRYPAVAHTRTNLIYRVEDGTQWLPEG